MSGRLFGDGLGKGLWFEGLETFQIVISTKGPREAGGVKEAPVQLAEVWLQQFPDVAGPSPTVSSMVFGLNSSLRRSSFRRVPGEIDQSRVGRRHGKTSITGRGEPEAEFVWELLARTFWRAIVWENLNIVRTNLYCVINQFTKGSMYDSYG